MRTIETNDNNTHLACASYIYGDTESLVADTRWRLPLAWPTSGTWGLTEP